MHDNFTVIRKSPGPMRIFQVLKPLAQVEGMQGRKEFLKKQRAKAIKARCLVQLHDKQRLLHFSNTANLGSQTPMKTNRAGQTQGRGMARGIQGTERARDMLYYHLTITFPLPIDFQMKDYTGSSPSHHRCVKKLNIPLSINKPGYSRLEKPELFLLKKDSLILPAKISF